MWEDSNPEIINSNGQRYRVGYDDFGWFSIQAVYPHPVEEGVYVGEQEMAPVSFTPDGAEKIAQIINNE